MSGGADVSGLFQRVTALEQDDAETDRTVVQIQKFYPDLSFRVTINYFVHEYKRCGDTNPICSVAVSTSNYL